MVIHHCADMTNDARTIISVPSAGKHLDDTVDDKSKKIIRAILQVSQPLADHVIPDHTFDKVSLTYGCMTLR